MRRVDPDADLEGEDNDRLMRIIVEMAKNSGGYQEGGHDVFSKWALGICGTLAVTAIVGGVVMYGEVKEFQAKLDGMQQQVSRVERIVEPRYRGEQNP